MKTKDQVRLELAGIIGQQNAIKRTLNLEGCYSHHSEPAFKRLFEEKRIELAVLEARAQTLEWVLDAD